MIKDIASFHNRIFYGFLANFLELSFSDLFTGRVFLIIHIQVNVLNGYVIIIGGGDMWIKISGANITVYMGKIPEMKTIYWGSKKIFSVIFCG